MVFRNRVHGNGAVAYICFGWWLYCFSRAVQYIYINVGVNLIQWRAYFKTWQGRSVTLLSSRKCSSNEKISTRVKEAHAHTVLCLVVMAILRVTS